MKWRAWPHEWEKMSALFYVFFFSFFKRIGVVFGCSRPYQFQAYEQLFSRSPSQVTKKREETFICWSFARLWYIGNAFYLWAAWVYHAAVKITSHFLCASCVVFHGFWYCGCAMAVCCLFHVSSAFQSSWCCCFRLYTIFNTQRPSVLFVCLLFGFLLAWQK